jgi:hypothetical protein
MTKQFFLILVATIILINPSAFCKTHRSMHAILNTLESNSEDMIEVLLDNNIKKSKKYFNKMTMNMHDLNAQKIRRKMSNEQLKKLSLANSWFSLISLEIAEADDIPALENAINQLTSCVILLKSPQHQYEQDIAWMDYLGREMLLLNKNYPQESSHLISLRKKALTNTWNSLKYVLNKSNKNKKVVDAMNKIVNAIINKTDSASLIILGEKCLDQVDEVEQALGIKE